MQVPFFLAPAPAGAKAGRALAWQAQAARLRCPPGTATHACRMARDEGKALCQRLPAPARQIRPPCPAAFCQRPRAPSSATRTRLARPAPSGPGLVSSAAQALRRACRRRHPLPRPASQSAGPASQGLLTVPHPRLRRALPGTRAPPLHACSSCSALPAWAGLSGPCPFSRKEPGPGARAGFDPFGQFGQVGHVGSLALPCADARS